MLIKNKKLTLFCLGFAVLAIGLSLLFKPHFFKKNDGIVKTVKISQLEFESLSSQCFVNNDPQSPNSKRKIIFRIEDQAQELGVRYEGAIVIEERGLATNLKGYFTTENIFWSKDSRLISFVNSDFYANSGDESVVLVDFDNHKIETIPLVSLQQPNAIYGKRKVFHVQDQCWVNDGTQIFSLYLNYNESSGHPGIDAGLAEELEDKFGFDDPMLVGYYKITI